MKLICPDCGKQYESGKFCQECGAKLQEVVPELVCPSCGFRAKSGKFCPECGTKLTEQCATPIAEVNNVPEERKFNEKDERFAKYYDKKGFPRTIPQEERAIAIEELTLFAEQGIAEAKMLLGNMLFAKNPERGIKLLKEAEESGDKLAYYLMAIGYIFGLNGIIKQNHSEAEKRLLECYQEFEDEGTAGMLAELYAFSEEKYDYQKAVDYANIAAEDDDINGYSTLGFLYLNGKGVEKNVELALENYKMAAAFGDEGAMNQIGFIFMGSEDFEANPEQSFYWFNEAAKKGHDFGLFNLGYCYQNGFGVERDMAKAAECFKKAAELGHIDAMYQLGSYYQNFLIDTDKAKMWYQKAAESGHAESLNCLGVIYSDMGDFKEAVKCFKKAVEQEAPMAYLNLATCYRDGTGIKRNLQKAEELFAKAAEHGVEDASELKKEVVASQEDELIYKANKYFNKYQYQQAVAIYEELAKKGNPRAQGNYGICILNGFGIKQNIKKGLEYLELSSNQQYAWSCLKLAEMYLGIELNNGKSVPINIEKAKGYISMAEEYGADVEDVTQLLKNVLISGKISNVKEFPNIKSNDKLGVGFELKLVVNYMVSRKLNFSVYCQDDYVTCQDYYNWEKSKDADYNVLYAPGNPDCSNGICIWSEIYYPENDETICDDFRFFISYSQILDSIGYKKSTDSYLGKIFLVAWDQTDENNPHILCIKELKYAFTCKKKLFSSDEYSFMLLKR